MIYWQYYKTVLLINVFLSTALAAIASAIKGYPLVFASFGFFISVFLVDFFAGNSKYLYYNLGYSQFRLVGVSFVFNLILAVILYFLLDVFVY